MERLPNVLMAYVSEKVVQDFRYGKIHDEEFCKALNHAAAAKHLRKNIRQEDAEWIVRMLSPDSGLYQRKLGLDLTLPVVHDERIQEAMYVLWESESNQAVRQSLIFALLNIEGLPDEYHRGIFEWIQTHLDAFLASVSKWYGGPDVILDVIKARTKDSAFRKEKHWIYLCVALASDDVSGARKFVRALPDNNWPFVNEVRAYAQAQLS